MKIVNRVDIYYTPLDVHELHSSCPHKTSTLRWKIFTVVKNTLRYLKIVHTYYVAGYYFIPSPNKILKNLIQAFVIKRKKFIFLIIFTFTIKILLIAKLFTFYYLTSIHSCVRSERRAKLHFKNVTFFKLIYQHLLFCYYFIYGAILLVNNRINWTADFKRYIILFI